MIIMMIMINNHYYYHYNEHPSLSLLLSYFGTVLFAKKNQACIAKIIRAINDKLSNVKSQHKQMCLTGFSVKFMTLNVIWVPTECKQLQCDNI